MAIGKICYEQLDNPFIPGNNLFDSHAIILLISITRITRKYDLVTIGTRMLEISPRVGTIRSFVSVP